KSNTKMPSGLLPAVSERPHPMIALPAWARRFAPLPTLLLLLISSAPAKAECAPNALGTSRVLAVDPATTPRVGRKHFPTTLPLGAKEVVLTFDDGPWPGTTPKVLAALKSECVKATFFVLGRNAVAHPDILRRELSEGHTVAHHTWSHPLLNRMSLRAAEAAIDHGLT